ncbi:LysR family transcriptional regulator [Asanoa ishikariensis]|uniref:Transcriptional regulator, LysR family n=1 Tax=Asanoa ishikariensis TaxID=137265 RepID=A0A1H3UAZ0_9ACTN|nr:LysR substrate-binding domain-containing protein [Asanoa ishikariensis]GIF63961.1 LysR family transcriptional regulator [Asanoa ishikariensis]SDZ59467.1 transcriptional regulator, LysR family [Asanoa ishikariensis]
MELRDIEIFLTLADELHFGRTAERLHVSQARVSQAIKAQERRIGGALFERTSRAVTLTPLGEQLRDDLRVGYDAIRGGLTRATQSARGITGTVRLGIMGAVGHEIHDVIQLFCDRHPGCDVVQHEIHVSDPFTDVRAGDVDLALVWRPVREPDLVEGPTLLTERRLLAVWAGHELADRPSVTRADFGGRAFVSLGSRAPDYWIESMVPRSTPDGTPVLRGPEVKTFHEVLHTVATRQAVSPLTDHYARYYSHPGIVLLRVEDAPPNEWALVWRTGELSPRARAFVDVAVARGTRTFGQD